MHAASETPRHRRYVDELSRIIDAIADRMTELATEHFAPGTSRRSDFFRDLASGDYMHLAMEMSDPKGITFEVLCSMFDAAILVVENSVDEQSFERHISAALVSANAPPSLHSVVERVCAIEIIEAGSVGTGYGRQRLPFPKEQIRSEILCHGLGAHALFPGTRRNRHPERRQGRQRSDFRSYPKDSFQRRRVKPKGFLSILVLKKVM